MKGLWNNGPIVDQANAAITGGNTGYVLASWDVPIIPLGSGSIGNNGALTGITALTTTYANAYVIVPAGAIAAGVPAAEEVYFAQFSSTTAATIFNNTLAANLSSVGTPTVPASPTAFATTGPGAFTGVTTNRTYITVSLPAGAIGLSGEFILETDWQYVNAATNKTFITMYGGSNIFANTQTTTANAAIRTRVKNRGVTGAQRATTLFATASATTSPSPTFITVNSAAAQNIVVQFQKATATESSVLEGGRIIVMQQ